MARGKDGALDGPRRRFSRPGFLVAVATLTVASVAAPAAAVTPLVEADVAALTSRAEAWTAARNDHRESAREQALALAEEVRQAEADRLAAEEAARIAAAERRAAEEIARTSTTTTTAPPITTAPPTTTVATVPPTTDSPDDGATTTTEPTSTEAPAPDPGEPTAAQWVELRRCESSGNYGIVSANGRYRGAYQFSQATWDWIAGLDHPSLVGIDPAAAAPADQDAMALALWRRRGWSPWPICGVQAASA